MSRKEMILGYVQDLVGSFLYYDRQDDEDLGMGDIQEAVLLGEVTAQEIAEKFRAELFNKLPAIDIPFPTLKQALKETGTPERPIYDFQKAAIQGKEQMYDYLKGFR